MIEVIFLKVAPKYKGVWPDLIGKCPVVKRSQMDFQMPEHEREIFISNQVQTDGDVCVDFLFAFYLAH